MRRWSFGGYKIFDRVFEWLLEVPPWIKGIVGITIIAAGSGIIVLFGMLKLNEGGKIGGLVIGLGVALVLLWANDV